jgi:hypothetical protein
MIYRKPDEPIGDFIAKIIWGKKEISGTQSVYDKKKGSPPSVAIPL